MPAENDGKAASWQVSEPAGWGKGREQIPARGGKNFCMID
jgi:hypothetical protein